jgi:hypothetical protein
MPSVVHKGKVYRLVSAEEEPSSENKKQMVQDILDQPSSNWKDYLQPIIIMVRQQFGLEEKSVSLVKPKMVPHAGSASLGFDIVGHLKFQPPSPLAVVEKHGEGPYKFKAFVTPDGKVGSPITIEGSKVQG